MGTDTQPSTSATTKRRPRFNPFSAEFRQDRYAYYAQLRTHAPLHKTGGMWIATRYADCRAVMRRSECSSSLIPQLVARSAKRAAPRDYSPILRLGEKSIVFTDKPAHTRLRRLFGKVVTPSLVATARDKMRRVVDRLLASVADRDEFDFVDALAHPYPLELMVELLQLPVADAGQIDRWTHGLRFLLEPGLMPKGQLEQVLDDLLAYMEYLRPIVRARMTTSGDDLVTRLSQARADDDQLSEEELIFACIMVFVAGHETTKCLLSNAVATLIEHPSQLAAARAMGDDLSRVVEEVLRFEPPLQQTKRVATQPFDLGGTTIESGDELLLCIAAANRDPAQFERPDQFDISRGDCDHLGFGHGIHSCLGGLLARTEVEIALRAIFDRFADLELATCEVPWMDHSFILRGPSSLPVRVRPR